MEAKLARPSVALAFVLATLGGPNAEIARATPAVPEPPYAQRPVTFELNQGQTDPSVQFLVRGSGAAVLLKPTEAVIAVNSRTSATARSHNAGRMHEPTQSDTTTATVRLA